MRLDPNFSTLPSARRRKEVLEAHNQVESRLASAQDSLKRADGQALAKHPYSENAGLKVTRTTSGAAEAVVTVTEEARHLNGYKPKIAHGGLVLTGLDTVAGVAAETLCDQAGKIGVTTGFDHMRFVKAARTGDTLNFRAQVVETNDGNDKPQIIAAASNQKGELVAYSLVKAQIVNEEMFLAV